LKSEGDLLSAAREGELMMLATADDISVLLSVSSLIYANVIESAKRLTGNLVSWTIGVIGTTGATGAAGSFFLQAEKKMKNEINI
jgi:hypothetical protein